MPVAGWCSIRSSNGDTILSPIETNDRSVSVTPRSNNQDTKTLKQSLQQKQQKGEQAAEKGANKLNRAMDKLGDQLNKSDKSKLDQARVEMQRTKQQLQKLIKEDVTNSPQYREAQHQLETQQKEFKEFLDDMQGKLAAMGANMENVNEAMQEQSALETIEQSLKITHERMKEVQKTLAIQQELLNVSNASSVPANAKMENYGFQNGDVIKMGQNCFVVRAVFQDASGVPRIAAEAGADDEGESNGDFEGIQIIEVPGTNRAIFPEIETVKRLTSGNLLMLLIGVMNKISEEQSARQ